MKMFLMAAAAASVLLSAGAAQADTYNQTIPTYFGSGNPPNGWTLSTNDDFELGLRGKVYQGAVPTPTTNVYNFALGEVISLEWSFDPNNPVIVSLSSLTVKNLATGGTATWDPLSIADNATNGSGGEQNSWRLSFGILNGAVNPFTVGDIDYGVNTVSTYVATWKVNDEQVRVVLNQGGGVPGAVPEPGTWALMILGFGGAGAMLRNRRRTVALA